MVIWDFSGVWCFTPFRYSWNRVRFFFLLKCHVVSLCNVFWGLGTYCLHVKMKEFVSPCLSRAIGVIHGSQVWPSMSIGVCQCSQVWSIGHDHDSFCLIIWNVNLSPLMDVSHKSQVWFILFRNLKKCVFPILILSVSLSYYVNFIWN